jgi:hypothetical protein
VAGNIDVLPLRAETSTEPARNANPGPAVRPTRGDHAAEELEGAASGAASAGRRGQRRRVGQAERPARRRGR